MSSDRGRPDEAIGVRNPDGELWRCKFEINEPREPDDEICVCSGGGPYPCTSSIGLFWDGHGELYVIGRTRENAVGAKVIKKSGSYAHDSKQRWILRDKQIFDRADKLVLGIIDNCAVMQEPNDSNPWQKWKPTDNGENIVSCHDPNICLQISDEGDGEYVVIGPLLTPPAKYQTWSFVPAAEGF